MKNLAISLVATLLLAMQLGCGSDGGATPPATGGTDSGQEAMMPGGMTPPDVDASAVPDAADDSE